jgi:RNA polymerase sigma-70 factor (ECF subfamily)
MAEFRDALIKELPRLRRFARGLVGNRETADDLLQDTLVRALAAKDRFHGGNLYVWLFVILINLNRNRLRGLARQAPLVDLDAAELATAVPAASGEGPDILRAIEHLPANQREVLLLVAVEGLSYAECAELLDSPIGTVMSRLARARQSLRLFLDGSPDVLTHPQLRVIK